MTGRFLGLTAVVAAGLLTACQGGLTTPVRDGDTPSKELPYRAIIEITPDGVRPPNGIVRMGIDCTLNSTVSVTVAIGEGQRLNKVVGAAYCGSKEIVSNSQVDLGLGYMISNSNSVYKNLRGRPGVSISPTCSQRRPRRPIGK